MIFLSSSESGRAGLGEEGWFLGGIGMTSSVRSRAHRLTIPNGHSKVWFLEVLIGRTAQVPRAVSPMQHNKRNGPRKGSALGPFSFGQYCRLLKMKLGLVQDHLPKDATAPVRTVAFDRGSLEAL